MTCPTKTAALYVNVMDYVRVWCESAELIQCCILIVHVICRDAAIIYLVLVLMPNSGGLCQNSHTDVTCTTNASTTYSVLEIATQLCNRSDMFPWQ